MLLLKASKFLQHGGNCMALIKYCQLVQFPVIWLARMSFSLLNFMVIRVKWHLPKDDLKPLQDNSLPCPDTQHQVGVWGKKEAPGVNYPHLDGAVYFKQELTTVTAVILSSKQMNQDSFSTSQLSITQQEGLFPFCLPCPISTDQ